MASRPIVRRRGRAERRMLVPDRHCRLAIHLTVTRYLCWHVRGISLGRGQLVLVILEPADSCGPVIAVPPRLNLDTSGIKGP